MAQIDSSSLAVKLDDPSELTELLSGVALHSNESMVSQIYTILLDLIVSLRLQPGQLVSEKEVAESLDASKTPVREALIRLEDSGLVQVVPKSGTYVTPISISAYIEGCFTRLRLETGAVRRAALRSDSRSIDLLDSIIEQQSMALDKKDYEGFFTLDQSLHKAFFDIAGVKGVWHVLSRTQSDVNRIRHLKRINKIRRSEEVLQQHQDIVEAIGRKDEDAAENALTDHIGSLETELEQLTANPDLLAFIEQQDKNPGRKNHSRKNHVRKRNTRKSVSG